MHWPNRQIRILLGISRRPRGFGDGCIDSLRLGPSVAATFVLWAMFCPIAALMASLITYAEYPRHYTAAAPAVREAFRTDTLVVFLVLGLVLSLVLQRVLK